MVDVVSNLNSKITGSFTGINWGYIIGWIVLALVVVGAGVWYFGIRPKNKKMFSKKITAFEIIGNCFQPAMRDVARDVKMGSGGFVVLYLKKLKTHKLAYGGKVGKDTYYFFIMPDGYWYNAMLSANLYAIDKEGGFIPVVTTNPSMRGQYTSLEKQIDSLHAEKKKWWDTYGSWVLSMAFVLVAGMMLWLCYQEYAKAMGSMSGMVNEISKLIDKINIMQSNAQSGVSSGLHQV